MFDYWTERYRQHADEPHRVVGDRKWSRVEYDVVNERLTSRISDVVALPASGSVLDVGCGIGRFTEFLAGEQRQYVGVDVVSQPLAVARGRFQDVAIADRVRFELYDGHCVPAGPFDVVWTCVVLQHVVDDQDLLVLMRSMVASMRTGGQMVLIENIINAPSHDYLHFRTPDEYVLLGRQCGIQLNHLVTWDIGGEPHGVFQGVRGQQVEGL